MSGKFIYLISFILLVGLAFSNIARGDDPRLHLVGWWKLDGDVNDSSGGGRNGVRVSNATPPNLPPYIAGMVAEDSSNSFNARFYPDNNAVNLTGNTLQRYIDLNSPGLGTPAGTGAIISQLMNANNSCTFTLWANYQNPGGGDRNQRFFSFGTSGTNEMRLMPRESSSPPTYFAITTPVGETSTTNRVGYGSNLPGGPGIGNTLPMNRWCHLAVTISGPNDAALRTYRLYIDGVQRGINGSCTLTPNSLNPAPTISWLGRSIPTADGQYITSYVDDFRIYDRQLSQAEIRQAMGYPIATFPSPGDPNSVFSPNMQILPLATTDVTLSWTKGAYAADVNGHHVYVGTDYSQVNTGTGGTDKGLISNTSYFLAAPAKGMVYYWRIDEVNNNAWAPAGNPWKGLVWSFRITGKIAGDPIPSDGATLVPPKMTLRWSAGDGATGHDVYFGTDNPPLTLRQSLTAPRSDPNWSPYRSGLTLEYNKTYYWQINEWEGATPHPGPVWSFTTVPKGPPEPNLVCWWKFDDNLTDSAYGCDGTAYGDATYPAYVAGFYERAIYFNNANNTNPDDDRYVDVPIGYVISSLRASTFTMWVNWPGGGGNNQRFFSFSTVPGNRVHFAPHTSASAPMHFQIATPASSPQVGYGANAPNAGTIMPTDGWHHVAVTIREPNATTGVSPFLLYLDGIQVGSNNAANRTPSNVGVTTRNWFGRSEDPFGQREYNGSLDDLRIYDKALTVAEIGVVMRGDPNLATKPWPGNWTAPDVEKVKPLSWTKGRNATRHDVYFGNDEAAVHDANTSSLPTLYRGPNDVNTYTPPETLEMNRTYYWRIDEVNGTKVWKGFVWRFTVADYLTVDDFESYNNISNKISTTWKAVGGALPSVGYTDVNYAEVMIGLTPNSRLHGGRQAMPVDYNNLKSPYDSNVYRDVSPSQQNWTRLGVKALSLWLRGNMAPVGSFTKRLGADPNYMMTSTGTDFNVQDWRRLSRYYDECHFAYTRIEGNCDIIVRVNSLTQSGTSQSRAGLMIRDSLDADSPYVLLNIYSGNLGLWLQNRATTGVTATNIAYSGPTVPYWLWLERYWYEITNSYAFTAWYSPSGQPGSWYALGDVDSTIVNMTEPVYIGLAMTARNAASSVTCVFSNVSITQGGTVTPDPGNRTDPGGWDGEVEEYLGRGDPCVPLEPWPNTDIGIKSNTAAPLYVTLQDSTTPTPKTKTIIHDDPNIALATTYTEWRVPIARFSDLNLAAIKKITVGIGPGRSVLPHVGIGTLYVDDVSLYIPRCITGRPRAAADLTANVNDRDDSDCIVGYADLQTLTNRWLLAPQASNRAIDMDDSNMVDIKDYAILAGMWLDQILWPPPVTKIWAYEFKNDANCYDPNLPRDANDLHLEFDDAVYLINTGPFSTFNNADTPVDIGTFRGNGTNKITLASGASTPTTSVRAYRRAIIRVGSTGTEKTLKKWWWTNIQDPNGVRTSNKMAGVGPSCKKID